MTWREPGTSERPGPCPRMSLTSTDAADNADPSTPVTLANQPQLSRLGEGVLNMRPSTVHLLLASLAVGAAVACADWEMVRSNIGQAICATVVLLYIAITLGVVGARGADPEADLGALHQMQRGEQHEMQQGEPRPDAVPTPLRAKFFISTLLSLPVVMAVVRGLVPLDALEAEVANASQALGPSVACATLGAILGVQRISPAVRRRVLVAFHAAMLVDLGVVCVRTHSLAGYTMLLPRLALPLLLATAASVAAWERLLAPLLRRMRALRALEEAQRGRLIGWHLARLRAAVNAPVEAGPGDEAAGSAAAAAPEEPAAAAAAAAAVDAEEEGDRRAAANSETATLTESCGTSRSCSSCTSAAWKPTQQGPPPATSFAVASGPRGASRRRGGEAAVAAHKSADVLLCELLGLLLVLFYGHLLWSSTEPEIRGRG